MILYLVCLTEAGGIADAEGRGWTRIARMRFATPEKHDVRVVRRFADMVPAAGVTQFVRAADFSGEPDEAEQPDAFAFARFVAAGHGRWVEL